MDVPDNDAIELRHRIRAARKARKWSQKKLAQLVGCDTGTISRLERGHGDEPPTLQKVLATLGLADATETRPESDMQTMQTNGEQDLRVVIALMATARRDVHPVIGGILSSEPPAGRRNDPAWWSQRYAELVAEHAPTAAPTPAPVDINNPAAPSRGSPTGRRRPSKR